MSHLEIDLEERSQGSGRRQLQAVAGQAAFPRLNSCDELAGKPIQSPLYPPAGSAGRMKREDVGGAVCLWPSAGLSLCMH